ncbi:MAG: bifunctional D-glycero-beta-D-manno-heptose-7-phosphate kinase/D-glycero-beta-D-manno-heptose 1-phosphate adenylyltransferase HldE [Paludibacteraceae bacterium]|nr:bifunctional D-glycero-beta-D-manno-heptose-7-phosphate kinase/D-glycero-beta-D-manno-heptose 1-phosphate adenylyltransferase HldE [Paludibacteraceae bacterium]
MKFDSNQFKNKRILLVGDIMLDVYTIGSIERISPEAPIPIVRVTKTYDSLGGCANVANNIASLGAVPYIIGMIGNDASGERVKVLLEEKGIPNTLFVSDNPTVTKNRIVGNNQQVVRVDYESAVMSIEDETTEEIKKCVAEILLQTDVVVLSDYAKGFCTKEICQYIIQQARRKGVPVVVDPKGADWKKYHGATTITPNLKELSEKAHCSLPNSEPEISNVARTIVKECGLDFILVTRSDKGMSYVDTTSYCEFQTEAREVADVSGAGDTVVAVLATCLAAQYEVKDAIRIANSAAGIVVGKMGTKPIFSSELESYYNSNTESKIISKNALSQVMQLLREKQKRIVFTNGCFDILHCGHVTYLQQAKQLGDILIVGVNSDASVKRLKGDARPINNIEARTTVLQGLSSVDYIVVFDEDTPYEILSVIRPDVLVKGGDYKVEDIVGREFAGVVKVLPFVDGYSTTGIVESIRLQQ